MNFMSLNINSSETDDATKIRGVKLQRWVQLRVSLNRNDIHVLGLQQPHYKACGHEPGTMQRVHDRLEHGTRRMQGQKWSVMENISLTPKSGVLIMWQHTGWTLRTSYSSDVRTLVCEFEDGGERMVVSAHALRDPGPWRKQWARLVAALHGTEAANTVLRADHKSVLHETLCDSVTLMQETGDDTYYRTATGTATTKEQEAYGVLHLMDTWPLVYEPTHHRDSMGLTYPTAEPRRRIDRVSVSRGGQGLQCLAGTSGPHGGGHPAQTGGRRNGSGPAEDPASGHQERAVQVRHAAGLHGPH